MPERVRSCAIIIPRSLGREQDCRHTGQHHPVASSLFNSLRLSDFDARGLKRHCGILVVIKTRHGAQAMQHVRTDVYKAGKTAC